MQVKDALDDGKPQSGGIGPGFLAGRQLLYLGFASTVVLNVALLRLGAWNSPLRVLELLINGVVIVALLRMVAGGDIIAKEQADLIANGWSPSAAADLSEEVFPFLDKVMRGLLAFVVAGIAWNTATRTVALIKRLA